MSKSQSYQELKDEALMVLVSQKETGAFDELYNRYSKRLLYYFYRMLGQSEEKAQDFLQDLFMKLIEKPERFDPKRKFSTWCFSIAHNMCKNEYRSMQVRSVVDRQTDPEIFAPDDTDTIKTTDLNRFTERLYEELDKMDEEKRTAFLLRHREGFSIKEISQVLSCNEGTIKSRIFYTNKALARKLYAYRP